MKKTVNRARMCVYLDTELCEWTKEHAIGNYRSFSSFLNKLMLDHKHKIESTISVSPLKSEIKR